MNDSNFCVAAGYSYSAYGEIRLDCLDYNQTALSFVTPAKSAIPINRSDAAILSIDIQMFDSTQIVVAWTEKSLFTVSTIRSYFSIFSKDNFSLPSELSSPDCNKSPSRFNTMLTSLIAPNASGAAFVAAISFADQPLSSWPALISQSTFV